MKMRFAPIIAVLAVLSLAGCRQEENLLGDGGADGDLMPVDVRLSRSDGPTDVGFRTYRVILMNVGNSNVSYTGTYISPEINTETGLRDGWLIPWLTDGNGNRNLVDEDCNDTKWGLYTGNNSTHRVIIVSPARAPIFRKKFFDDGRDAWGFPIERCANYKPAQVAADDYTTGNDNSVPLYVSQPIQMNLAGALADGDNHRVLDFGDRYEQMLIERRSAFRVKIDADPLLGSAKVAEVGLTNFTERAFLYIGIGDYIDEKKSDDELPMYDSGATPITVTPTEMVLAPDPTHSEHKDKDGNDYIYLLSHDYSVKENGVYKETGPVVVVHLIDDDDNEIEATVKLQYNFEPHREYTFHVTVASRYMMVRVESQPWDTDAGGNGNSSFSNTEDETMTFPIGGWEPDNGITTEI